LDLEKGRLYTDEISSPSNRDLPIWWERITKKKAIPQLIFMSACWTGLFTDLCERFFQAGTRYFVAPLGPTRFNDSALFSTIFYMLVYVERKNPFQASKKIWGSFPKISGKWQFYDAHQHVFEHYDPNGVGRL